MTSKIDLGLTGIIATAFIVVTFIVSETYRSLGWAPIGVTP